MTTQTHEHSESGVDHGKHKESGIEAGKVYTQRWSTPLASGGPEKTYPGFSYRHGRNATTDDILQSARDTWRSNGSQFRDIDWGDNEQKLLNKVSSILRYVGEIKDTLELYFGEHTALKARIEELEYKDPKNSSHPDINDDSKSKTKYAPEDDIHDPKAKTRDSIDNLIGIEQQHAIELAKQDQQHDAMIRRCEGEYKSIVAALQADVKEKDRNLSSKQAIIDSLEDQKSRLIFDKDQLQSKIEAPENSIRDISRLQTRNERLMSENQDLLDQIGIAENQRDNAVLEQSLLETQLQHLTGIIHQCPSCRGLWELFTLPSARINEHPSRLNVWHCDFEPDTTFEHQPESSTSLVDTRHDSSDQTRECPINEFSDEYISKNFRGLVSDIENLCTGIAFNNDFLAAYIKTVGPDELGDFSVCFQRDALENEMFLAYLQREIWRVGIQRQRQNTESRPMDCIPLEERIKERLNFRLIKASVCLGDLTHMESLMAAISNSFINLAAIVEASPEKASVSLDIPIDKSGFDLFPIIRKSNGSLLLGRISIKRIEDQATVIPITPVLRRRTFPTDTTSVQNDEYVLVRGTAAVYEPRRSGPMQTRAQIDEFKPKTDVPLADVHRRSVEAEEAFAAESRVNSSEPRESGPPVPPRPVLHRKPKLPLLDTSSTSSTPTNSPILRRHQALRTSALKEAPLTTRSVGFGEHQDSPDTGSLSQQLSPDVGRSAKKSVKSNGIQNKSGTPLAAIWRTLEERDKRNSGGDLA
ncbi:hypothetical protein TWF696_001465 [Orbilia brochopaga]|uniref:Uncharacterized protein n=1 Tax=Orbilia brochopaga TaxID=3140254 RepID=A0AAV9U9J2_9PEZI